MKCAPAIFGLLAVTTLSVSATPYLPSSGQQVIETLPRRGDPVQQELRRLRAQLAASPADVALASTLAQRYIALGRSESDPRYLGYAQAALAPWWQQATPPSQVRLLRATLRQSTHQFDAAQQDLKAVLAAEPANAQAWLTLSTVQTVQGEYEAASASCARLSSLANQLITVTCIANVGAVTGRARNSEQLLALTLERSANAAPELQRWALTLLAEMAQRRGTAGATEAQARFQRALALDPHDSYLLGAYADFLLDQQRPNDVLKLLGDEERIDALLLRRALARQQLGAPQARALAADVRELAARFDAAAARGDSVHQREQARFELALRRDSAKGLLLARNNWAVQKEPADMRILLEAAVQAGDRSAAQPVLDWIARHKVEDAACARLARTLEART